MLSLQCDWVFRPSSCLLFYKIQFYPAIYHSPSTLQCLSLFSLTVFLLSSHSLMWVINEALVGRPSSPYVSGVSQQHVSHTLSVSHSFIHTLVFSLCSMAFSVLKQILCRGWKLCTADRMIKIIASQKFSLIFFYILFGAFEAVLLSFGTLFQWT